MAKTCKLCPNGTWECGDPNDLCLSPETLGSEWQLLGTIKYNVYVAKVKGECTVKIQPA